MNWVTELQKQQQTTKAREPKVVGGVKEIPAGAEPADVWRLELMVIAVVQKTTKQGAPYYFLNVEDKDGMTFSVVCWSWGWKKYQGFEPGKSRTLDLRIPLEGYKAWNLA